MREIRGQYEEQIEKMKAEKHKALVEINELRNNLESTEKKLKKETTANEILK